MILPVADPTTTRRLARTLLAPRALPVAGAVLALTAVAVLGLAGPIALGVVVDAATGPDRSPAALLWPVVVLVVVAVVSGPLTAAGRALVAQAGEPALADLRERVVDRALRLPLVDLERAGSGDLLSRVGGDVAVIATAVRNVAPTIIGSALTLAATLAGLGALDWRFAVAGLCAVPVQAWTLRWYLRTSGPVYAAERRAEGARAQRLVETAGATETIRALGTDARHTARIADASLAAVDRTRATTRLLTRFFGRLNLAELIGLTAILAVGFVLVGAGVVELGAATAAALFFVRLFDPINALLGSIDDAQAAASGLARLTGVLQVEPPPGPVRPAPTDGTVTVRDLRFAYRPGQDVLRGIDLSVPAGTVTALVGASGAGKSTVAALVAGQRPAGDGAIALGDTVPRGPADLRPHVGLVTQEVHVFSGTVRDDLLLAAPDADDETLWAVLRTVDAETLVAALPEGLDTVVGAGGHALDPAAAQHLALARLVLADPPVAVLDEATADAGSAGARRLEAAARAALAGRTAIVVAHRLSQAARADRIVVLDHGVVVESGTHAELLAAGGTYAALWMPTRARERQ
ncbi:MAG: hypothetical protein ABS81_29050 [Pseudonocardia sp. SCN 72-86]|nr:MAG: hypothetical protein ABS81_29050 [Pseudonocardia sp. SCN 72-86]